METIQNNMMPQLRFPEFKRVWNPKRLDEIAVLTSSKRVYLADYVDEGIPFYRGKEITELKQNIIPKNILYITEDRFNDFKDKYGAPKQEDILITAVGTLGNVYRVKTNSEFYFKDGNLIWLRKVKENSIFLEQLIDWKKHELIKVSIGSTQKALTIIELNKVIFLIPTLPEQTRIANFLTAIDKRINLLQKKKIQLEQYKKGIMQKLFSQTIRFKDKNGNNFPDWEEKKLGEVCEKMQSGGTPKSTNKKYYNGNISFLSINDMTTQGKYLHHTAKTITHEGLDNSSSWLVPINSLIYSMYASVGFVSINKIPIATSQAVINMILKKDIYLEYLYYYLLSFKERIGKYIETGTQGNINAQIVKSFVIPFPTKAEQQKIASFLSSIDTSIDKLQLTIDNSQLFKKGLLQKMFV